MRLNSKWAKTVYVKSRIQNDDGEGGISESYSSESVMIEANIQPATSKLQADVYGERISGILNMYYTGTLEIKEGYGVCVYVDESESPDYKVISPKPWNQHTHIELEKI